MRAVSRTLSLEEKIGQMRVEPAHRGFRINFKIVCQREVSLVKVDKLNFAAAFIQNECIQHSFCMK